MASLSAKTFLSEDISYTSGQDSEGLTYEKARIQYPVRITWIRQEESWQILENRVNWTTLEDPEQSIPCVGLLVTVFAPIGVKGPKSNPEPYPASVSNLPDLIEEGHVPNAPKIPQAPSTREKTIV